MRGPCIEHTQKAAYGSTRIKGRFIHLHRKAYADAHGLDPFELDGVVMHECDNPRCVNPLHLRLGTYQDNTDDMIAKGRQVHLSGEDNPRSKLTSEQVDMIKEMYIPRSREFGARALGRMFGVSNTTVRDALKGRTWA